jgi:CcmD family protein
MDATNAELYKLVLADAPYVIAAYAVLWAALIVYVTLVLRRLLRLEKEMAVLEDEASRRAGSAA